MAAGLLHLGVHRGEEHTFLHVRRRIAHRGHGALESGNRPVPDAFGFAAIEVRTSDAKTRKPL